MTASTITSVALEHAQCVYFPTRFAQVLAALSTGDDCQTTDQAAVDAAQTALNKATSDKKAAEDAVATALATPITFSTQAFSALKRGECDSFFNEKVFTDAESAVADAKKDVDKATGAITGAEDALAAAKKAQDVAVKKCFLDVRCAYDKAFKSASANKDKDAEAYTKSKHMECVLKGTPSADCVVGDVPAVTPITLAKGVPANCMPPMFNTAVNPELEYSESDGNYMVSSSSSKWQTAYGLTELPAKIGTYKFYFTMKKLKNTYDRNNGGWNMVVGITTNNKNPHSPSCVNDPSQSFETGCFGYTSGTGQFYAGPQPKNMAFNPHKNQGSASKCQANAKDECTYTENDVVRVDLIISETQTYANFYLNSKMVGQMSKFTKKLPANAKFRGFVTFAPAKEYKTVVQLSVEAKES